MVATRLNIAGCQYHKQEPTQTRGEHGTTPHLLSNKVSLAENFAAIVLQSLAKLGASLGFRFCPITACKSHRQAAGPLDTLT